MHFVVSARGGASAEVKAPNWLAALGLGLDHLGTVGTIDRLACEVLMNGTVLVRDARTGEGYVVRPLDGLLATAPGASSLDDRPATAEEEHLEWEDDSELIEATLIEEPTSEQPLETGASHRDAASPDAPDWGVRSPGDHDEGAAVQSDDEEDVTERLTAVERPGTPLAGLSPIADAVSVGLACDAALSAIQAVVESESGSVLLCEPDGALRFASVTGPSAVRLRGSALPRRAGIAGFVIARAAGLIVHSARADPRFYGEVDRMTGYRTRSLLCVPLVTRETTIGCIQLLNPPKERQFGAPDLWLAQEVAEALTARLAQEHLST